MVIKEVNDEYNFYVRIQIQIYSSWYLFLQMWIQIYCDPIFKTNTNTNIFGLTKMGEYEYEY